jgi:hypothetical protein
MRSGYPDNSSLPDLRCRYLRVLLRCHPQGKELMGEGGGLCIFHGTKDTLICGCYGVNPWLLSGRKPNVPQTLRRVKDAMKGGHEQDWIRACKESAGSRVQTKSNFLAKFVSKRDS